MTEKKSKKKVDPNVEKDIRAKLIQGVPATNLIKDHGYARSTVYKVRQEVIDEWEKAVAPGVAPLTPLSTPTTGFNPGEVTITTEPIAFPSMNDALNVPAHNIFYLMFAELQRMNRGLIQINSAINLMNDNAQAERWRKTSEQSTIPITDPEAMKKNVAVVMRNMIPEDILKSMPPHLRKAYDGLLGTLAAPNDPVWSDEESNKPDPREPASDRSIMDPFTKLSDTLNRVSRGITSVDNILYGSTSKGKSNLHDLTKVKPKKNDLTTPVNPICPECKKDIPSTLTHISLTPDGKTWHKECFHKHLELQQQKAEDEMNKDKE